MARWIFIVLMLWGLIPSAMAEKRIALVIGNKDYANKRFSLDNPINDASLISETLRKAGFEIFGNAPLYNLVKEEFESTLAHFATQIDQDTVAAFYYAGHGGMVGPGSFLYPADWDFRTSPPPRDRLIDVRSVVQTMQTRGGKLAIVMLDACRNNAYRSTDPNWPAAFKGARDWPIRGATFVSFSADVEGLARDEPRVGPIRHNSPYALALSEAMLVPGLTLTEVFQRVRDGVAYYTGDQQLPWSQSYLAVGDFYFKPRPRTLAQLAAAAPHTVVQDTARAEQIKLSRETLEWILDSADARVSEELESYASAIKEKEFAFLREDRSDNSATRVNNMFRVAYASPVLEAAYRLVRQYAENKESEKMVRLVALFDGKGFFKSEQAARHIAQVRKASSVRDNITFKAALCDIGRAQPTYRKAVLELARFDRYKDDPPLEPGVPDWSFLGKGLAEVVAPMVVVGMAFSGKGAKMPPPEKPACSF